MICPECGCALLLYLKLARVCFVRFVLPFQFSLPALKIASRASSVAALVPRFCSCIPPKVAEALIAAKADLGIVDALGRSALHISCSEGRSDIVQLLLASGIDANVVDQEKQTALHKAAYYSNVEVVRSLFQHEGSLGSISSTDHTNERPHSIIRTPRTRRENGRPQK
eukprot:6484824-Amphidinium_carterae.1